MTERDRILAAYRGETSDRVPCMLDLSHWFYHRFGLPWDLSQAYEEPETALIDYHRRAGVGFYMPNLAVFFRADYAPDVEATTVRREVDGVPEIAWRLRTPAGEIERRRRWEPQTYAWAITQWGVRTPADLRVFARAHERRAFRPEWGNYEAWQKAVGDNGVVYLPVGYSAIGQLMNYWMGPEQVIYATVDCPDLLRQVVDAVNANNLELIDLAASSPAEVIVMGDNFSSDLQPPSFFAAWSAPYYREAIRRLHAAGKSVAVHIDGRLRGALRMIAETGADAADAVTPAPMGDLTPAECRAEAGAAMLLSGGVPPDLWLPSAPLAAFLASARAWLDLRHQSPRLIANAGDQVPPGAAEDRIAIFRDLVAQEGGY